MRGSTSVFVENRKAQRAVVDPHSHGGAVLAGSTNVFLGSPVDDAALWAKTTPGECAFLEKWDSVKPSDPLYDPTAKGLARLRARYTLSEPTPGRYQFDRRVADEPVSEYEVNVRGHRVTIVEPLHPPPAGEVYPTPDQIAAAIALWPDSALDNVDTVVLSPTQPKGQPPNDPALAWTEPGARRVSYGARAPNDGQGGIKTGDVDWAMVHEGGHVSASAHGDISGGSAWADAVAADRALSKRGVSLYGDKSAKEDYAESVLMYALTVNTPCEGTARRLFPNRYAILERDFAGCYPTHGASA